MPALAVSIPALGADPDCERRSSDPRLTFEDVKLLDAEVAQRGMARDLLHEVAGQELVQ
jgi:hypothetical protein